MSQIKFSKELTYLEFVREPTQTQIGRPNRPGVTVGSIAAYETSAGKRYRVRYRKPDRSQTDQRGFRTKCDAELFLAATEVRKATREFIDATAAKIVVEEPGARWLTAPSHP